METIKYKINKALENKNFSSARLIKVLKEIPILSVAYLKNANNYRTWTLEEHTITVLNQFEKYFSKIQFPAEFDLRFLRLSIALHDIGKPFAAEIEQKYLQHQKSKEIFDKISSLIPFSFIQKKMFYSIFLNDTLGSYLRGFISLTKTLEILYAYSYALNINICTLVYINTLYYQCDVASYTKDALEDLKNKIGEKPLLDFVFDYDHEHQKIFDEKLNILKFSSKLNLKYKKLLIKIDCYETHQ